MKVDETIYMDQSGYDSYLKKLKLLKMLSKKIIVGEEKHLTQVLVMVGIHQNLKKLKELTIG